MWWRMLRVPLVWLTGSLVVRAVVPEAGVDIRLLVLSQTEVFFIMLFLYFAVVVPRSRRKTTTNDNE